MNIYSSHGLTGAIPIINVRWEPNNPKYAATMAKQALEEEALHHEGLNTMMMLNHENPTAGNEIGTYLQMLRDVRDVMPNRRLSFYGRPPYRHTRAGSRSLAEWRRKNDLLAPLTREVDYLAPSLYSLFDTLPKWIHFADLQLEEARRISGGHKMIIGYMWHLYHQYTQVKYGFERNTPIPLDMWLGMLRWAKRNLDGVVLWGLRDNDPMADITRDTLD